MRMNIADTTMATSNAPPQPVSGHPDPATDALKPFQLEGVRDTGVKVGDGSYATVMKLEFRGLKCVGKKIHALLYEMANQHERREILRRFVSECELLARLHHPCIVQFLGVYFEEDSQLPVIVMEYLYATLAECLDRYGVLPEEITYGILRDVALGLRYLHENSPPIIHRDLSANNVLLATDMRAKISDLGLAKIINLSPAQMTQRITTQAPGTPCYMPPEALVSKPSYTSKIDSYSYGVVVIHILCGEWPFPGDMFTETPNAIGSFLPVSEFDRRREHIMKIGLDHPLMGLIRQCLSNAPASRPEVSEILGRIEDVKSTLPPSFENKLEMIHQIQSRGEDTDGEQLLNESPPKSEEDKSKMEIIARQKDETETQGVLIEAQRSEIELKTREVLYLRQQNMSQDRKIEAQRREVQELRRQIETLRRLIEAQQSEMELKTMEVTSQSKDILSLREQLEKLSIAPTSPSTTAPAALPVHPHTQIQWRRCADLPVGMNRLRAILFNGMVYVGGGYSGLGGSTGLGDFLVFQYNPRRDVWVTLPPCPVRFFTLSQFQGHLIVVGGLTHQGVTSNKVYRYREQSQEWEEYLKPMPTPRYSLSVITTTVAIVVCAGGIHFGNNFATVEVYLAETGEWHTADPLPNPYADMTTVVINDNCYFLGGGNKSDAPTRIVLYAQVSSLIESAMSRRGRFTKAFKKPPWKTLPDTPLFCSTAASVGGRLLAVGGCNSAHRSYAATHLSILASNTWAEMHSGDLPVALSSPAAIELPGMRLLVCGGSTGHERSKATYIGCFNA